jgi:hypothetical protein
VRRQWSTEASAASRRHLQGAATPGRKLFIVSRERSDLFASLRRVVAKEPGVDVIYDRRTPGPAVSRSQADRRMQPALARELQDRGFAVVRMTATTAERQGRIWAA